MCLCIVAAVCVTCVCAMCVCGGLYASCLMYVCVVVCGSGVFVNLWNLLSGTNIFEKI